MNEIIELRKQVEALTNEVQDLKATVAKLLLKLNIEEDSEDEETNN